MNKFPTENELPIPNNIGSYENHFAPINFEISVNGISNTQRYYLHKCGNTEYQEYSSARWDEPDVIRQSEDNPQTIYFYNDEIDYSAIQPTLQLDSKRTDEVAEEDVEERSDIPTTLYFINKEESDS